MVVRGYGGVFLRAPPLILESCGCSCTTFSTGSRTAGSGTEMGICPPSINRPPAQHVRQHTSWVIQYSSSTAPGCGAWPAGEGAELPTAAELADQALAISDKPTVGRLKALWARAFVSATHDRAQALREYDDVQRMFERTVST